MLDARSILDAEFLEIRARLLDLAAAFDRIERADGSVAEDPRMTQIARGVALLARAEPDESRARLAEDMQMIFSLPFQPAWRQEWGL